MDNLVMVDKNVVRDFGGSLYVLIPKSLRVESELESGDEITFSRAPGSTDTVIRIVKKASISGANPN